MEASENKKLSTKDMARAESDEKDFEHSNEEPRSLATAEPAIGIPSQRNMRGINGEALSPLLATDKGNEFRLRWQNIQTSFVDEPQRAVELADELVAEIMRHLAQNFSDQRSRLEPLWQRSEKVSTEELRVALRSYRSFFDRLLTV